MRPAVLHTGSAGGTLLSGPTGTVATTVLAAVLITETVASFWFVT
jgi:hypothetical protein